MMIDIYFSIPASIKNSRRIRKIFWYTILFANLAAIIFIWYTNSNYYIVNPEDGNIWKAMGRLTGLLAEFAILLELILIGRIRVIEQAFGFDKMNRLHRWIGYLIVILLFSHPIFLTIGTAKGNGFTFIQQFGDFLTNSQGVFPAFVALVIFSYIIVLSIPWVRKKHLQYETWYFTHLLTYLAIGLAFNHQIVSGDVSRAPFLYYWLILNFVIFFCVLFWRFIKPIWNAWRFEFRVTDVTMETKDIYSVYISGKNIEKFNYDAGQFAYLTFLQKGLWYTHPFSFSIEPNPKYLRFTIKALGDHTKRILELKTGTRVIIDGPLGLFIDKIALRKKLLFIAGGIGITPIRSLIGYLITQQKDFVLLYSVRTIEDIVFRKEFDELQKIHNFKIYYISSTPTEGYETGLLDREKLVRLVPDFFDRDVYLCGPPPMMAALVMHLNGLGISNKHIHYERFAF